MHARFARGASRSAALAAALTATLTCATVATAQPNEPTSSATADPAETPATDAGSVAITAKDTDGDVLPGASFFLLDSTGQETGRGKTDAQGQLTFPDLAPGIYRLKETDSGSPLHDVAADQDVIVTPGATAPVTVIDTFKPAHLTLKAKDNKTGKLLPGSTANIGTGDTTLLTLTTGPKGTASGDLPISSRTTKFWVKQTKAPSGYALYKPSKTFTAGPGAPVAVTVTNSKTLTGASPAATEKATAQPTSTATKQGDKTAGGTPGGLRDTRHRFLPAGRHVRRDRVNDPGQLPRPHRSRCQPVARRRCRTPCRQRYRNPRGRARSPQRREHSVRRRLTQLHAP
ncbi:SpaA isopeptide-forming pilin-related protein [Streptomyces mirabilis]|nr:SpaA isopeptide-forming pilin-related protein [Streptomyces mirabilis]